MVDNSGTVPKASTDSILGFRNGDEDAVLPLQKLPVELWAVIFVLALPDSWKMTTVGSRRLYFAQVCHHWRELAFSIPALWATVRVHDDEMGYGREEAAMAELERTRQTPLHLDLNVAHVAPDTTSWSSWTWLCTQTHRWESVALEGPSPIGAQLLTGQAFPILRSLHLTQHTDFMYECSCCCELPLSLFRAAPRMSEITIRWDRYDQSQPDLVFPPPPALVSISFDLINMDCTPNGHTPLKAVLGIIWSHKDTLRKCEIISENCVKSLPSPDAVFPVLEDLCLDDDASTLLYFIAAPNLTTLTLDNVSGPYIAERPMDFQCALHRLSILLDHSDNCPHLRSLSLNCIMLDLDLFLRCLRRLPSLTNLEVISSDFQFDMPLGLSVVNALKRDAAMPSSIMFLPRLTTLMLASEHKSPVAFRRAFATAVRSRIVPMTVGGEPIACLTACHSITPGASAEEGEIDITLERVQEGYGLGGQEVDHPSLVRELEEWRRGFGE